MRASPAPRRIGKLATASAVASAFAWTIAGAAPVRAQVIEVGASGAVVVYDRPAVFLADGVEAISRPGAPKPGSSPRRAPPPSTHDPRLTDAATAASLSPDLVAAVAWRESNFRSGALSPKGARGEMQLMPDTARMLGVDPSDTRQNYRGGSAYLRKMLTRYDGDLVKALAAYNAGPGAVDRHHGAPPFKETQAYVAAILDRLSRRADAEGASSQ